MNYGTDFLIINGDIVWEGDNISTISGEDNVTQQSELRMLSDLGENIFYRDYGAKLFSYLGRSFSTEVRKSAEAEARAALLRVGSANGQGWIEQILECSITRIEGEKAFKLYAKYKLRGDKTPKEISTRLEV